MRYVFVLCAAPCLSVGIDECGSPNDCHDVSDALCYCKSECYISGQCCPDINYLSNCLCKTVIIYVHAINTS